MRGSFYGSIFFWQCAGQCWHRGLVRRSCPPVSQPILLLRACLHPGTLAVCGSSLLSMRCMATWTALKLTLPIAKNAYAPLRRDAPRSARRSVSAAVCGVQLRLAAARRTPMRAGPPVVWAIRLGHGTDPVHNHCRCGRGASLPRLGALRCGRGEPGLGTDLAGASLVLGPMAAWTVWQGSATATMATMDTVGVCWLLLVYELSRTARRPKTLVTSGALSAEAAFRIDAPVPLRRCYE